MRQLLEWSGMGVILIGIALCAIGLVVLIINEDNWVIYVGGYAVIGIGALILLWSALRDRIKARKTEDLDDVGFN